MFWRPLPFSASLAALLLSVPLPTAQADWINDFFNDDIAKVRAMPAGGNTFQSRLFSEYRSLALFEADEMYDWPASDYFAKKALSVNAGEEEIPTVPQIWNINEKYMPELVQGREKLTTAFERNAKTIAPIQAAIAQARYDCWVEQIAEGYADPWQPQHIADCKGQFLTAMDRLNSSIAAARSKPESKPVLAPAPQPEPARAYVPLNEKTVVYFGFDRSDISADAQKRIDALVSRIQGGENIVVTVEAHTDRAGSPDYNKALSQRRAAAVRNELIRQGLDVRDVSELTLKAEGESDPAVKTADGIRHPLNRRANITAYRLEKEPVTGRKRISDRR